MCGIAGIIGRAGNTKEAVQAMVGCLSHRGPDDQGIAEFDGAVLGHARLSIIDIDGGHQPLSTCDERFWITFNGEIYNYRELRRELARDGYVFRTNSDTEVLLATYQVSGVRGFRRLNGMFAFAIWDMERRCLVAVRDQMGKKPFFFSRLADGTLIFASEIKALFASGLVDGRLNPQALDAYLTLGYIPPNLTAFADIHVLQPAHYMSWRAGNITKESYWTPQLLEYRISEGEATEELQRRVNRAVSCRMVADVPVGAFLSGGLDSSTVVALMANNTSHAVKTFSVGFGGLIDELPYARAVAKEFGTEHHEIQVNLDVAEQLERMADIYDEPLSDSSNIPTHLVCRFATQEVKVVLTGDGGDEMFGGYDWWYRPLLESERLSMNSWTYIALRILGRVLATGQRVGLRLDHQLGEVWRKRELIELARTHADCYRRHLHLVTCFRSPLRKKLWLPEYRRVSETASYAECPPEVTGINRAFWFDVTHYLVSDILVKVDRAAMAVGLEPRCPLLDPAVVEFALALPASLKLADGGGKYIFKKAFQHLWPQSIRGRNKQGFGSPEAAWLRRPDVRALVTRAVSGSESPLAGILDATEIRRRTNQFYAEQGGFSAAQVWNLLTLGLWLERWNPHVKMDTI